MTRHAVRTAHGTLPRFTAIVGAVTLAAVMAPLGAPHASASVAMADPTPAATDAAPTATSDPTNPPASSPSAPTPTPTPAPATPSASRAATSAPVLPSAPPTPVRAPAAHAAVAAAGSSTSFASPHGPFDTTSDQCALCHRAHTAQGRALLVSASPQSVLCFTCHDGTGSNLNVSAQYGAAVPANDPTTASYYTHDVSQPTAHILASGDEFGRVLNRHTECGDCHNPHRGAEVDSVSSPDGTAWTASGRISGISGLAVTNGYGGSAPSYVFRDGTSTPITAEYQLCLKCHSGYTKLLPKDPAHPSRDMLDAGIEFNPANDSFHPVEGAGTNQTPKMALSLSGPSAYKLWTFTPSSTVRCTNCHSAPVPAAVSVPAGSDLAPHASANRGILAAKYEDRVLTSVTAPFQESNFALCFLCHTDSPFVTSSRAATNFSLHEMHTGGIAGNGPSGGTIDTPGAGGGNALCAECHFRPHSTATTPEQGTRLVAFAPNVLDNNGVRSWTSAGVGAGSCTLTCHGKEHAEESYSP